MDINDIIIQEETRLYGRGVVNDLVKPDITDYERGCTFGEINMLNKIKTLLGSNDEDESDVNEKEPNKIDSVLGRIFGRI